jgi:hypothetical protein
MSDSLNDLQYNSFGTSSSGTARLVMGKYDTYSGSIALAIGGAVGTTIQASTIGGVIYGISMGLGTMTGTGTAYLRLVDSLGGTIASGTQAEAGTTYFGTTVPITTSMNWYCVTAGTQEGTQALFFRVHYQR